MSNRSIVGQIYGYGVSLLGILIILVTIHGIVNNAFQVVHPTAGGGMHAMFMHHFGGPGMEMQGPGAMMSPGPGVGGSMMQPGSGMMGGAMNPAGMRANMLADARFNAIRLLVVNIFMLIAGIYLFRWHWDWLHKTA